MLGSESDRDSESHLTEEQLQIMATETYFRNRAKDYHRRYYGHCNTSTDIKEANFFGR